MTGGTPPRPRWHAARGGFSPAPTALSEPGAFARGLSPSLQAALAEHAWIARDSILVLRWLVPDLAAGRAGMPGARESAAFHLHRLRDARRRHTATIGRARARHD